jgi:hypothetical protein
VSLTALEQQIGFEQADNMETFRPFLITIDTEGDNLWEPCPTPETRNARYLPRFQTLCEKYGLLPTYLANYEMANSREFQEFAIDAVSRRTAEVGMHLHAWDTPPITPLTECDWLHQPFLFEYPDDVMNAKVDYMTKLLEDTFGWPVRSHRAGRWGFDMRYAECLRQNGYLVDCSVTPYVDWRGHSGAPKGVGGQNFSDFPTDAYFIESEREGALECPALLEVPVTIRPRISPIEGWAARRMSGAPMIGNVFRRRLGRKVWLRPTGRNLNRMTRLVDEVTAEDGNSYLEFMLHSSELMPGGHPRLRNDRDVDRMYRCIEGLFSYIQGAVRGCTLSDYALQFTETSVRAVSA